MKISRARLFNAHQHLTNGTKVRVRENENAWVVFYGFYTANVELLEPVVREVQERMRPLEGYQAFERAKRELAESECECGPDGSPLTEEREQSGRRIAVTIFRDPDAWRQGLAALKAEHAEALAAEEVRREELSAWLDELVEFEPYMVRASEMAKIATDERLGDLLNKAGFMVQADESVK